MSTIAENVSLRTYEVANGTYICRVSLASNIRNIAGKGNLFDFIFNQNIPKYTAIFVDSFTCMVILARSIDLSKKGLKSIGAHFQHQITSLDSMS